MGLRTKRVSSLITFLFKTKGKLIKDYADVKEVTVQGLRNQLSKANYSVETLIEIAEYLGVDVGFKDGNSFYSFLDKQEQKRND